MSNKQINERFSNVSKGLKKNWGENDKKKKRFFIIDEYLSTLLYSA